jgi:hypothetical protein
VPTYEVTDEALHGYLRLDPHRRLAFRVAQDEFIEDIKTWEAGGLIGHPRFRESLRVKNVKLMKGVWEMTWQWPDGRATFQYGLPVPGHEDQVHSIWRRIGTHRIFDSP